MFEFIKILTLRAAYECQGDGVLPPYLGSTVRGILGHCIRDFCCEHLNEKCFRCEKNKECLYVQCFSNTGGEAGAVNSYTLYVHVHGKEKWTTGDMCVFDLTLFGKGVELAGIYLDALQAAERKGWGAAGLPFRLVHVTDPDTGRVIYAEGRSWIRNLVPHTLNIAERKASFAYLTFDTPLRIVSGGNLFETLPFDMLMKFLIRRISLLTLAYTDFRLEWDEEALLAQARKVRISSEFWKTVPFSRYSMNQKTGKLELPSKMGRVLYEGDLSSFVPMLEVGKYLRIGKGATIGFGHYEVSYDR